MIKKLLIILTWFWVLFYSCKENEIIMCNNQFDKDTIKTVLNDLKFKIIPISVDQFKIIISGVNGKTYQLFLENNNQVLHNCMLDKMTSTEALFSTVIRYNFSPYKLYNIVIREFGEDRRTVSIGTFTIFDYKYKYIDKFHYELIASIHQRCDFDISPSRDMIFYNDYIDNKFILRRLSITDKKLEIIDDNFFSRLIRVNNNKLIVATKKINNHFLGGDSCALLEYDLNTHKTSFIDWGSDDYGRYSRVVNNSIMVTNPLFSNLVTLIDLSDNSKRKHTEDFRYLREYNFDQIYVGNKIYDFSNASFTNILPFQNSNSSIVYYDKNSQYIITEEFFRESPPSSVYYSKMVIYKNNKIVYEQPFEKGRTFCFPKIINLNGNKLIFHQYYDYESTVRYDGYYQLDLITKEIIPLHYESNIFMQYDFFNISGKNSFISIRSNEIFKITMD